MTKHNSSRVGHRKQSHDEPGRPSRFRRTLKLIMRQKRFVFLIIILLLLYVVSPQLTALGESLKILSTTSPVFLGLAMTTVILTYALASEVYFLLVKHPIPLQRLLLVQAATALTSRLAPIGVGTIGLNIIFLRHQRHTTPEAVAVAAANNGLGVVGHLTMLFLLALTGPVPENLRLHVGHTTVIIIAAIAGVLVVAMLLFARLRRRILHVVDNTLHNVASYRHKPKTVLLALCVSMAVSIAYVTTLAACARAVGVQLPFAEVFMIYTLSLLTGVATPTPGGLVGVEAGLVAGFIAYGIDPNTALATALLYRLVTYWLPLLPGLIALRAVQHRYF